MESAQHLELPDGRLGYDVTGVGPLVAMSPGMGDLRTVFRDLAARLVDAGFRVACAELRGHGDSSTTFTEHGLAATAGDLTALVDHLGGPAVLVGSSVSAGSAALAAANRPDAVSGLVMLNPHLHSHGGRAQRASLRFQVAALLARPWGAAAWAAYYTRLNRGRRADWLTAHVSDVRAALRDPAHLRSFRRLALNLVTVREPIDLGRITVPTLVVHGEQDPEFTAPADELAWALEHLTVAATTGLLVPEAGHYPHAQRPDVVAPAVLDLLKSLPVASHDPDARG